MTDSNSPHRLLTAMQQAGYAVTHSVLEGNSDRVVTVTIVPSQRALGFIQLRPKDDQQPTAADIRREGLIATAGLVAMRKLTGSATTSCSAGLIRAHTIAERYVYVTDGPGADRAARITEVMADWDRECSALVDANEAAIRKVSAALLERNTLSADDLNALLANVGK
ncbi:MAG: hypothetical protein SGJ27_30765 [Candidatus Melainabacteria bacterium]|nr:hypothetical protein [Candidatus Melainabacteria bacterium]